MGRRASVNRRIDASGAGVSEVKSAAKEGCAV